MTFISLFYSRNVILCSIVVQCFSWLDSCSNFFFITSFSFFVGDTSFSETQAVVEQEEDLETGHHEDSNVVTRVDARDLPFSLIKVASGHWRKDMRMKKTNHMLGGRGYIGKQKVWRTEDDGFNQRCEWGRTC